MISICKRRLASMPIVTVCRAALLVSAISMVLPVVASQEESGGDKAVPPPPGPYISSRPMLSPPQPMKQQWGQPNAAAAPGDPRGARQSFVTPSAPHVYYAPTNPMEYRSVPYGPGAFRDAQPNNPQPVAPPRWQPSFQPQQQGGWHW